MNVWVTMTMMSLMVFYCGDDLFGDGDGDGFVVDDGDDVVVCLQGVGG